MNLLIENGYVNGEKNDVLIEDDHITHVGDVSRERKRSTETVIDASDQLVWPTFHNGHTHAGMSLFRGFADDLPLRTWLEEKIWPLEEKLTREDVYWATRLACLEMIQTGTTFFNDMYWEYDATVQAVRKSGLRARIAGVFIDQFDEELAKKQREINRHRYERRDDLPDRIEFALGPHSIYTVSQQSLEWIADFSRSHDLPVHIHLSETEREVEKCRDNHGLTPVRYLDELGLLHENVIAAHGLWMEDSEIEILADSGASLVYNPISNLKLAAGGSFQYDKLTNAGVPVCLGTDGVASNNNLNLFEEIKIASILQKNRLGDPTVLPAGEAINLATTRAADIFGLETGRIREGALADLMLVRTNRPDMSLATVHDPNSHVGYTAGPESINTVVCDGNILMHNGSLRDGDKEEILERHRELARNLGH